jgi:hypothetical protein
VRRYLIIILFTLLIRTIPIEDFETEKKNEKEQNSKFVMSDKRKLIQPHQVNLYSLELKLYFHC